MSLDNFDNNRQKESEVVQDFLNEFAHQFGGREDITDEMFEIANNPESPLRGEVSYRIGCAQLDSSGSTWFTNSAEAGYPQGMYALARECEIGMGEEPDLLAASYWHQEAAKRCIEKSLGKSEHIFARILESAKAGNAEDMFDVGASYETGALDCVKRDIRLALEWYEKAASLDYVPAALALWQIYYTGAYGIAQDLHKAIKYIKAWSTGRGEGKPDWRKVKSYDINPERREYITDLIRSDFLVAFFENDSGSIDQSDFFDAIFVGQDAADHQEMIDWIELDGEVCFNWKWLIIQILIKYRTDGLLQDAEKSLADIIFYVDLPDIGSDNYSSPEIHLSLEVDSLHQSPRAYAFEDFSSRKFRDSNAARCRRVESTLREMAQRGGVVAKLLLGLILIGSSDARSPDFSEGQAWLEETVENNDLLGCLCYAHLARSGRINVNPVKIKSALKQVIHETPKVDKDVAEKQPRKYIHGNELFTEEHFHVLRQRASEQLHEIELEDAALLAKDRAEKDMLSYLTHTLNNTLSSGPESARQAMRILGSELYENNREYKAINNIASMFSTFLFAQQLLKTFKLYIAEPETLRLNWDADVEGDANIAVVLAVTLRQTLSQVVFASNHQAALQRLLPHKDTGAVKAIRRAFMDNIVPLDVDASNTGLVFDWVQNHLGLIHVNIDPAAELHFRSNSTRYTFFFSSFSELIYNALKYSDGIQPIEIIWGKASEKDADVFVFRCVNTWTDDSIQSSEGSCKGLVYLARLAEMLGATFEKRLDNHRFIAEIHFPVTLLGGQA